MPLGLISDSEFDNEFENSGVAEIVVPKPLGRGENNVEVPDSLRKVIGETSELEGRKEALALGNEFGISNSSVSAYAHGATSTASYNTPDSSLSSYLGSQKLKAGKRASQKLLKALHHITEDKLESAKPVELAVIAKAMSGIVKDMEPETPKEKGGANAPTFVLYAPRMINESKLEVIEVKE